MATLGSARTLSLIVGLILLVELQGCAHKPEQRQPLPETLAAHLGTIGVVALPEAEFRAPGNGRLAAAGRGAKLGSIVGIAIGGSPALIGAAPLAVVGAAGGAVAGTMPGAIVGAVAAEPWGPAEAQFRSVLAELKVPETFADRVIHIARASTPYSLASFEEQERMTGRDTGPYSLLASDGVRMVIELSDLVVELRPGDLRINPNRRLFLSVHARLIRPADGAVLDQRRITDELGGTRPLAAWTESNALAFREEVTKAAQRLAEQIVEELFLLHPLPERCEGLSSLQVCFVGPKPMSPSLAANNRIPEVHALQPELRWEPFPGSQVTYDLKIWRAEGMNPGVLAYSRDRLSEPSHRLEAPLQPGTTYYWTVRTRFTSEGRVRVTTWGRQRLQVPGLIHWFTLGITKLVEPGETYFAFRTPTNLR